MFIVTGGAGFIGSALVWKLNEQGLRDVVIADRMGTGGKWKNLAKRRFTTILHKNELFPWLDVAGARHDVEAVFHLGASSSTTETDVDYLVQNNLNYSIKLWQFCVDHEIPFIYASSAATYGEGELGFVDDPVKMPALRALNPYGFSKQKFDDWVMSQKATPPFWAGLKFFNVYGPQEYHKGSQSSVVPQFVPQVQKTGKIRLFKSYREGVADGQQKRDFVYVKDCVDVMWHLFEHQRSARAGIYNIGSGQARSWNDLANAVFTAIKVSPAKIEFIDMPENLRTQYQYFTEASLSNLRERCGYKQAMTTLEDGVLDYVQNYLVADDPYL